MTFNKLFDFIKESAYSENLPLQMDSCSAGKCLQYTPKAGVMPNIPWGGDSEGDSVGFEFVICDDGEFYAQLHWGENKKSSLDALLPYLEKQDVVVSQRECPKKILLELNGYCNLHLSGFNDAEIPQYYGRGKCAEQIVGRSWDLMEKLFNAVRNAYDKAYPKK